jgi:hypothetical protein
MNKEELLNRLDYFIHSFEEKAVNEFYVIYLNMIDDSDLDNDKKNYCREVIKRLSDESRVHIQILEETKQYVESCKDADF